MPCFFVAGATGKQGGAVAHQLLAAGHRVRALVRDLSAPTAAALQAHGAELIEGTHNDATRCAAAFAECTGAFFNTYFDWNDPASQQQQIHNLLTAATAVTQLDRVVLSTAFHASYSPTWAAQDPQYPCVDYYAQKVEIEDAVRNAGIKHWTILRPAFLMYNYLGSAADAHFPELRQQHILAGAYRPHVRMPHFDENDDGKFAVAALTHPSQFAGKDIELGYQNLSLEDASKAFSQASGMPIRAYYRNDSEVAVSKSVTQPFHLLANQFGLEIPSGALDEYGIPLTSFEEYLEKHKVEILETLQLGNMQQAH